jgi:hypothetical protein
VTNLEVGLPVLIGNKMQTKRFLFKHGRERTLRVLEEEILFESEFISFTRF